MTALTSRGTWRLLARVYAVAVVATALVTLVVAVAFAPETRADLGWTFPGVPATLASAAGIFTTNAPKLIGAFGAALVVQAPWIGATTQAATPSRAARAGRTLCDVALAYSALRNLAVLGLGLGAYGHRMLLATLPHGPVELLAFALGAVVYLRARRGPLPLREGVPLVVAAMLTLAVAAALETFVPS